jgi:hypothetical protein
LLELITDFVADHALILYWRFVSSDVGEYAGQLLGDAAAGCHFLGDKSLIIPSPL